MLTADNIYLIAHTSAILRYCDTWQVFFGILLNDHKRAAKTDSILEGARKNLLPDPHIKFCDLRTLQKIYADKLGVLASQIDDFGGLFALNQGQLFGACELPCHCDFSIHRRIKKAN